jgi:DNA-directed RNA polymerase subunit L
MTLISAVAGEIDIRPREKSRNSSMKRHYEGLISSIKADNDEQIARIRQQRHTLADHLEGVISRCTRLETAVKECTKEIINENAEKQKLQIRVEEMQTSIEQKIRDLRKRIEESDQGTTHVDVLRLRRENDQLRIMVEDLKVSAAGFDLTQGHMASQSSEAQEKISQLQLDLYRYKSQERDLQLHQNPAFREKIKQIERLALRYAPLTGPGVDHLFSEIEYAKDVIDGHLPPPKLKRWKSINKRKDSH